MATSTFTLLNAPPKSQPPDNNVYRNVPPPPLSDVLMRPKQPRSVPIIDNDLNRPIFDQIHGESKNDLNRSPFDQIHGDHIDLLSSQDDLSCSPDLTPQMPTRCPHNVLVDDRASVYSETYSQRSDRSQSDDNHSLYAGSLNTRETQPDNSGDMQSMEMENDEYQTVPRPRHHTRRVCLMRGFIGIASFTAIAICIFVLYYSEVYISQESKEFKESVRMPCNELTKQVKWLSASSLEGYRVESSTECDVPLELVLNNMVAPDFNLAEAQVKLQAKHKGDALEYSYYNLSMQQASTSSLDVNGHYLLIQEDGHFFIFFNVQLSYGHEKASPTCNSLRFKTSVTHLLRHRNQKHTALLRAEHSCCETCDTERSTVFTGGLFYMRKNDRLFLQVSAPKNIGNDNYLGMFQMSSQN